jgi:membrane protein implicated in regulation of membrane protease activity
LLISPALAFDATPGTGSSGGAIALSIILAVAITSLVVYVILKKWRRRRLSRRDARIE